MNLNQEVTVSGADGTVWSRWVVEVWGPDMEGGPATVGTARHAKRRCFSIQATRSDNRLRKG